jgi:integral membrane protein (TIGR01906 family)
LRFESGEALYLERELDHLLDVKIVLQGVFVVFGIAVATLLLVGVYSQLKDWRAYLPAISSGGRLTALLLMGILLLTAVSFRALFTNFHLIFFEGDSWLFNYSDTLIRLFPMQFWQDAFIVFGLLSLIGGVLLGWVLPLRKDGGQP